LINVGVGILNMDDMAAVRDRSIGSGKLTIQEKGLLFQDISRSHPAR
jgi:hypothetical protein